MTTYPDTFYCPITHAIMRDPYMDLDGNSYEKDAIMIWLQRNGTSPITRTPMQVMDLRPNRALRDAIASTVAEDDWVAVAPMEVETVFETLEDYSGERVRVSAVKAARGYAVTLHAGSPKHRTPVNLVCVIDISGSMRDFADIKTSSGTETNGMTILDITKHALKTIIAAMDSSDQLSLVTFSTRARTELALTAMTPSGKQVANNVVDNLRTEGMTNLWDGIKHGLEVIETATTGHRMTAVYVLTDGQPTENPPRGVETMTQEYINKLGNKAPILYTFGFGYNLDSKLLSRLAIMGKGTYAFIPDAGMVGTIFINALAGLFTMFSKTVKADNFDSLLQYEQPRSFTTDKRNITLTYKPWHSDDLVVESIDLGRLTSEGAQPFAYVNTREDAVARIMNAYSTQSYDPVQQLIQNFPDDSMELKALLEDLTGQVKLAFDDNYFHRWGRHYLPALARAHLLQMSNNFKDPGLQVYGGPLFKRLQLDFDKIFDNLPPPQPSRQRYNESTQSYSYTAVSSMATYNSSSDPCYTGSSIVETQNGFKRVRDVRKGDAIFTGIRGVYATVKCVVRTEIISKYTYLCKFPTGLVITPYHPILWKGTWQNPKDIVEPKLLPCDFIYSFVLEDKHVVEVNGLLTVTLGHNFKGDLREHSFFGSPSVIKSLQKLGGFDAGLVEAGGIIRDPTGLACDFVSAVEV